MSESLVDVRKSVPRLVLTGTYNSCNKGDAAMELGALHGIACALPGSEVTILTPFPELDASFYAPVPVLCCNRRKLIRATLGLVRALIWGILRRLNLEAKWLLDPASQLTHSVDLVVDLSGDMLTEDYGVHVAYSHYIPLLRALFLGRPYVICAQSVGPFRYTRRLARLLFTHAAAITVRDAISRDYLLELGLPEGRVRWTADLAFLMAPASPERGDEILREAGIFDNGRPILGVSMSRLIEKQYRKRNVAAGQQDFLGMICDVIQRIRRENDTRVVLVPHVTGPSHDKDDRIIAAELRRRFGDDAAVCLLGKDYRPEELKAVIARCTVFLGARMHANIAALSSCVPTVALSYSHKTPGIMASCEMEEFVAAIEVVSAKTLGDLVALAFVRREKIVEILRSRVPSMKFRAMQNMDILKSVFQAGNSSL